MAEPRTLLLLCVLVLCLSDSSFIRGQTVRSKRCDIHTKFVTHTPCTACAAIRRQLCPWGWSRNFPEKILLDCRYELQLRGAAISLSGCSQECWKDVVQKACCPGYWGSQCFECPGGPATPCSGHGTCLDGIEGNGTCVCQENFSGSVCQECRDPNRFGPDCQSVCNCVHGVCSHGPRGDGSCRCFAGYTGPHCDQELPVCQSLKCPQNSQCSAEAPTCKCLPGYTQQDNVCLAPDPCQPSACSPLARCSVTPQGQAQCQCPENYHGDGKVCLPRDPCLTNFGGCPSNSTFCLYRGPGKATCMCRPGMTSINNNASEGCHVSCKPHSCDRSATCQVTPDRKTRWAQSRVGGVGSVCLHSGPGGKDLAGGGIKGTVHPSPDRSLWVSSCVCKNDEVGDGHACYGHLLHEVRRANQNGLVFHVGAIHRSGAIHVLCLLCLQ